MHALNNLFCNEVAGTAAPLAPMFDKASLDAIAEQRQRKDVEELGAAGKTFFNQHRSALGLGNFDVVVVETAVAGMGCTWQWFDARQGDTAPTNPRQSPSPQTDQPGCADVADVPALQDVVGVVVNVQTSSLMGAWKSKHWYALRHCRGFNLQFDSKLEAPQNLGASSASLHRLHVFCLSVNKAVAGDDAGVREHLKAVLDGGGHVFIVGRPQPESEPEPEPEASAEEAAEEGEPA